MDTAAEARESIDDELRLSFYNTAADVFASYVDYLVSNGRIVEALAATELIRAQSLQQGRAAAQEPRDFDTRAIAKQRGATILTYSLGPERSHLWISTAAGITHVPLPRADELEPEVATYLRDLLSYDGTLEDSGRRGQRLYEMLVQPAAAHIPKGSRVLVIADGILHALNFETLVVPGVPQRYWIEDVVVSNAPSLQLLARTDAVNGASASMLLLGDPVTADAAFPKLRHAADEIVRVQNHFKGAVVLSGAAATPAAYAAVKPQRFEYMHVVAHGVSSRKRPLESAIILSRDASEEYKLFARDVVAQPLQARLVTLSSCRGAGERTFTGEGLVGLAWAFLRAGSDQVVAALWDVNDDTTPELMDRMYAGIRAGRPPDIALRDAKLALLKGKGIHRMAYYWAPFVLYSGS
jgi:CHAT domain-containing protein